MSDSDRFERDLREAISAAGDTAPPGPCPDDAAWLDYSHGGLPEKEEERLREHLAACAACVERARDARDFVETLFAPSAPPAARPGRIAWWLGVAAAALLVAGIAHRWGMFRSGTPGAPGAIAWNELAVTPAAYAPPAPEAGADGGLVYRDGATGDPFETAMRPYQSGDFAAAERALESFVAAHPGEDRARFYLAVTRLLNRRTADARRELERLDHPRAEVDHDEVAWYLALALLKSGDEAAGRARLATLAGGSGARAADARALLERTPRPAAP